MTAAAADDHDSDGMIALLPAAADAERLAVGDVDVDELHLTLAYLPDVADFADPQTLAAMLPTSSPINGEVNGTAKLGSGGSAAVWLVNAPGLTDLRNALVTAVTADTETPDVSSDFDGFLPHITWATGDAVDHDPPVSGFGPVTFDRLRVSLRGEHHDVPLGSTQGVDGGENEIPESGSAVA